MFFVIETNPHRLTLPSLGVVVVSVAFICVRSSPETHCRVGEPQEPNGQAPTWSALESCQLRSVLRSDEIPDLQKTSRSMKLRQPSRAFWPGVGQTHPALVSLQILPCCLNSWPTVLSCEVMSQGCIDEGMSSQNMSFLVVKLCLHHCFRM